MISIAQLKNQRNLRNQCFNKNEGNDMAVDPVIFLMRISLISLIVVGDHGKASGLVKVFDLFVISVLIKNEGNDIPCGANANSA